MPESPPGPDDGGTRALRPFWSGTISFGLVNVPVGFFVANRGKSWALRMVDTDGVPLRRRYLCAAEDEPIDGDEIVRGFEVDDDRYVVVEDDELTALAPEKSQEIVLDRFVPTAEIDPVHFERAYFLAPDGDATRAYRLLASVMEESGRAGIATFVMRGKEYLTAIVAERGILRAETLRFADEVRTPAAIGLPKVEAADPERVKALVRAMRPLEADRFERDALLDPHGARLRALAQRKLDAGVDVVTLPDDDEEVRATATVIDMMEVLKRSLQGERPRARRADEGLERQSKRALYERAQALDIDGRSRMSKDELIDAIRAAG